MAGNTWHVSSHSGEACWELLHSLYLYLYLTLQREREGNLFAKYITKQKISNKNSTMAGYQKRQKLETRKLHLFTSLLCVAFLTNTRNTSKLSPCDSPTILYSYKDQVYASKKRRQAQITQHMLTVGVHRACLP